MLEIIKDVIGYLLTFGGGIAVCYITQNRMDKRQQKELDKSIDEEYKKELKQMREEYTKGLNDVKDMLFQLTTSISKSDALMELKINNLTEEVRLHNNFARRMPVVEEQIETLNDAVKRLEGTYFNDGK